MIPHDHPVLIVAEPSGNGERLRQHLAQQGFDVELEWPVQDSSPLPRWLDRLPGAVILEEGSILERSWDMIKSLKENPKTRDIPVLVFALNEKKDQGSVLELNYITKPLNNVDLINAMERQVMDNRATGHTILVVDDEPSIVDLHSRMIDAWSPGSHILKAGNGKEALDIIHKMHPDLVLLDLMMPELDGFGVLKAMRTDPSMRDIPVIVLTGQTLTAEDMARLGRGVANVLSKGLFRANETMSHIEAALRRSSTLGNEARRAVRKAMMYLHGHYMEPISLEETAHHVSMSKEYLARCFRQEMGITLVTYLNRYRIKQAKKKLELGEGNLTEVALETGFSSSAYFSRVFRQEVGMSPSDYMKTMRP